MTESPEEFFEDPDIGIDPRRYVSDYFRMARHEVPATSADGYPTMVGRCPVEDHQRSSGGGLRIGSLLTNVDSLGGLTAGFAVLPQWIVTSSMMATISELEHVGPLRIDSRVLRRGRTSVVTSLEVVDEGASQQRVATVTATFAVLDAGDMELGFSRPLVVPMAPARDDPPAPETFFAIEPSQGPLTRLRLDDRLRNPWGILHGGGIAMLSDVGACRAAAAATGRREEQLAASDTVLHYLRPSRVGPIEARAEVIGSRRGRTLVRVPMHDVGADGRLVALASVVVLDLHPGS